MEEIKSKEILKASQNKNNKWILLLAIIYAIAIKIPLCFIYQKEWGDLKDM